MPDAADHGSVAVHERRGAQYPRGGGGLRHLQCPGRHSADVRFPQWADGGVNSAIFDV